MLCVYLVYPVTQCRQLIAIAICEDWLCTNAGQKGDTKPETVELREIVFVYLLIMVLIEWSTLKYTETINLI